MVADLFELHQRCENHASALNTARAVNVSEHVVDDGLVESGLFAGQVAINLHLHLVGQIDFDEWIALEASEQKRADDVPESPSPITVVMSLDGNRKPSAEFRRGS